MSALALQFLSAARPPPLHSLSAAILQRQARRRTPPRSTTHPPPRPAHRLQKRALGAAFVSIPAAKRGGRAEGRRVALCVPPCSAPAQQCGVPPLGEAGRPARRRQRGCRLRFGWTSWSPQADRLPRALPAVACHGAALARSQTARQDGGRLQLRAGVRQVRPPSSAAGSSEAGGAELQRRHPRSGAGATTHACRSPAAAVQEAPATTGLSLHACSHLSTAAGLPPPPPLLHVPAWYSALPPTGVQRDVWHVVCHHHRAGRCG